MPAAAAGDTSPNFWGSSPATEHEYYSSHNIHSTKSFFTSSRNTTLFTRSWTPNKPPRAAIFMIHGYGNDISWTFQSTPISLARAGFACFALDLPGHGRSPGLRAFIPDLNSVADDCIDFFRSRFPTDSSVPKFLYGESMGGALCLMIELRMKDEGVWAGAVLVAPMCRIAEGLRPVWPVAEILTLVARFLPRLAIVPVDDLVGKAVKVVEKREIAMRNPMRYCWVPDFVLGAAVLAICIQFVRVFLEILYVCF